MNHEQSSKTVFPNTIFEEDPEPTSFKGWALADHEPVDEENLKQMLKEIDSWILEKGMDEIEKQLGDNSHEGLPVEEPVEKHPENPVEEPVEKHPENPVEEPVVEDEEFPVRAPAPNPTLVAEGLRRANPIPADKLMKNIFEIMTDLSKELLGDDDFPQPMSSDNTSPPQIELGETSRLVKRFCILFVGLALWMIRVLGLRGKFRMIDSVINMIKAFEEELSQGDYDQDFGRLDSRVEDLNFVLLPSFIKRTSWLLNRFLDYPFLSGFLLGAALV